MILNHEYHSPDNTPALYVGPYTDTGTALQLTGVGLTNANALHVAIVNTNGDQLSTMLSDGTNAGNILKSDGTAAGQNSQLVAGTGYTTATITLNSGTPATVWFDMLNYAWVSVEVLTNTTPATLTFQTSGDASETNTNSMSLIGANAVGSSGTSWTNTTTSAVGTFHGPRTGRYFRISSNNGAGTTTLVITFFTLASGMMGFSQVGSSTATGSAVPANAFYQGLNPQTALPTAATAGNLVGATADKFGRQVALLSTIRDLVLTQTTTISASTSETTIGAQVASTFLDLIMLIISNTSTATNTRIDFRDTTAGSVLFSLQSNGGQPPIGFSLATPIPQTSVNTNWTAQCATSTTDVRVYLVAAKNK